MLSHNIQHSHKIYPYLCCMQYMLNVLKSNNTFSHDLAALLGKYPNVDATAMGFPKGWQEETLWR